MIAAAWKLRNGALNLRHDHVIKGHVGRFGTFIVFTKFGSRTKSFLKFCHDNIEKWEAFYNVRQVLQSLLESMSDITNFDRLLLQGET